MPRILIALAVAAALAACGEARDTTGDQSFATGTVCPPASTLTYENFGRAFFGDAAGTEGYCNYCHASTKVGVARNGAPDHAVFDFIGIIREHAREIDAFAGKGPAGTFTAMPFLLGSPLPAGVPNPQPIPSDPERENLSIWLVCGAP